MGPEASTIFHNKGNKDMRATMDIGNGLGRRSIRMKFAVPCRFDAYPGTEATLEEMELR
jgi:hypothetical protein